ncbi:ATP-binding protein [Sphingomonas sp. Leaf407]|uniref:DNA-packaging protein n=1 Tax=unclassified Sphingomonas TaxID=196159 RepID=UPI0006FA9EF6|nr:MULTISPECIES: terminase family protein [unclassified Sphingomonas]KQN39413.1 ATP-binding protein [Sphingomonas sp. Leaf42]KQT28689.1 ATP-binding protein [Sphingomonas sp. Leaf407]
MSGVDAELALLSRMDDAALDRFLLRLQPSQRRELATRWGLYAHRGQSLADTDWSVWLIQAGRGFGKTRAGAEWVCTRAVEDGALRIALVGATRHDVESVMVRGEAGLMAVGRHYGNVRWWPSRGVVEFGSGAEAQVFSAETPDALRGPAHHIAWCDELTKWRKPEATWDNLMLGLRLGERPQTLVTTTPRAIPLLKRIRRMKKVVVTTGRTHDNAHLPAFFMEQIEASYAGTRMGRQEMDGELIDEAEGALWSRDLLDRQRVAEAPPVARVVVGVDPPAGIGRDACGIVAAMLGTDGRAYVLEDASVVGASPEGWARAVAACAARHGADRVVAESNQGGAMVESVLRAADTVLPVMLVHASRGKVARAEPVMALYELGKAFHVGMFPALEDELCGLVRGGGYAGPGRSPDRADALVWALWELMLAAKGMASVRVL